jgi:glycosyltransferase involved in cell wall biosynthesis
VVESIVAGVPVVTGDVGDRREMLEDGALGCVVQPGDAPALADALIQLLQEPERRRQMAEAALASRDKWYWDRLVQRFAAVYERGPDALR